MSLLTILTYPDPFLRKKAKPVKDVDDGIKRLIDDMVETMFLARGIGLAATQVGDNRRVIVLDVPDSDNYRRGENLLTLINPEIIEREGETTFEEGCLSFPGFTGEVTRSARVVVTAMNREGVDLKLKLDGLTAIGVQHEIDHLNGILFIDKLSITRRELIKGKIRKSLKYGRKSM